MIVVANFEIFSIRPDFILHFRKVAKFQRFSSKAVRVIDKNLEWGSQKTPWPEYIKASVEIVADHSFPYSGENRVFGLDIIGCHVGVRVVPMIIIFQEKICLLILA